MKNIPWKTLLKSRMKSWNLQAVQATLGHDIADVSQVLYKYLSALNYENKLFFFFPSMDILLP